MAGFLIPHPCSNPANISIQKQVHRTIWADPGRSDLQSCSHRQHHMLSPSRDLVDDVWVTGCWLHELRHRAKKTVVRISRGEAYWSMRLVHGPGVGAGGAARRGSCQWGCYGSCPVAIVHLPALANAVPAERQAKVIQAGVSVFGPCDCMV